MKNTIRFAAAVLLCTVVALPMFAARGSANFSSFVALGDSYGAGVSSNSMNERHQVWSWPAVIARQAGLKLCPANAAATDPCWAQPLVSFPGFSNELILTSLAPTITPAPGTAQPLMLNFARPYNNLSIPGATVGALLSLTGAEPQQPSEPTAVSMGRVVLRGLGTPIQQADALNPTFVALWIGGNDLLGAASSGTTTSLTSAEAFRARYEALLDGLIAAAPGAGMVVGTLPVSCCQLPYFNTIPPVLVDPATRQPILIGGQPVYFIAELGDGTVGQLGAGSLVLLTAQGVLAQGYGLPAALKNIPPFSSLPHVGEPLPDRYVLTPAELQVILDRGTEFNKAIVELANARQIPVADIKGLFDRVSVTPQTPNAGLQLGPIRVTNAYITGGFFSLDGFHLTDLGYLLFGNEYIKAINAGYETRIPLASIFQLAANNGADFENGFGNNAMSSMIQLSPEALAAIQSFWAQPTIAKRRVSRH